MSTGRMPRSGPGPLDSLYANPPPVTPDGAPQWVRPPDKPAPDLPPIDVREQVGEVVLVVAPTPIGVDPRGFPV